MANYLKKTKMHAILCDIFEIAPKVKETDYRFYRGTEWLRYSDDGYSYEICVDYGGNWLTAKKYHYNYDDDKKVEDFYKLFNGYGKCEYPIAV